ncbi:MAG: hypothetical protein IT235_04985, partial [Bacteroidia bacterium]|nr:hypothetical protein [Bacteroidia bacterium]
MFRLENIYYLYAGLLVPVFILLFALTRLWRKKAIRLFGDPTVVNQLIHEVSTTKPLIKFILALIALSLIIVGIVNPQIGSKLQEVKRKGADV